MAVIFKEDGHSYTSVDLHDGINWLSVTSLIKQFKEPFDEHAVATRCSKSKKSKWYKMPVEDIKAVWEAERNRSTTLGTWYHNEREKEILSCNTISINGIELPVFPPIYKDGVKIAPEQTLVDGIYPEHFAYLKTAGVCGQADYIEVIDSVLNVKDYKTNKEIKRESYRNWDGVSKKMLAPLAHLEDCHLVHYGLQLSIYAYIICKHNPHFKVGELILYHAQFEEDERDEFDNPVLKLDHNGNPILKNLEPIVVPYYKREVEIMFDWLKKNRDNLL